METPGVVVTLVLVDATTNIFKGNTFHSPIVVVVMQDLSIKKSKQACAFFFFFAFPPIVKRYTLEKTDRKEK